MAGVAPSIVYLAEEDRVLTISGLGRWPKAATVAYFKEHCGGKIPPGVLRCITPGSPDAWITALERYTAMAKALTAIEVAHLAKIERLSVRDVLGHNVASEYNLQLAGPALKNQNRKNGGGVSASPTPGLPSPTAAAR